MKKYRFVVIFCTVITAAGLCYGQLRAVEDSLIVHLDAGNVELSGSQVIKMIDQSGRGNDALANSEYSAYRPALSSGAANGHDAVDFAGGKSLEIGSSEDFNVGELTMFVIYKYPDNPDTNIQSIIVANSYDMRYVSEEPWPFNALAVRSTVSLYGHDGKIKAGSRAKDSNWCGEMQYPFSAFTGWNLAIMVFDSKNNDSRQTIDGNVDMYANPGSAKYPTLEASLQNRWYEGSDSCGAPFTLENHIMTTLGGQPNYVGTTYPGVYTVGTGFGGMIAEVIIYADSLTQCEIASVVDTLQNKYSCGNTAPLLDVPTPFDCRYWRDSGRNIRFDLSGDCKVDLEDYAVLAGKWLDSY